MRPVQVHRLLVPDTVEDRILALQEKKKELIETALDETAAQNMSRLGVRELGYLFVSMYPQYKRNPNILLGRQCIVATSSIFEDIPKNCRNSNGGPLFKIRRGLDTNGIVEGQGKRGVMQLFSVDTSKMALAEVYGVVHDHRLQV